jgi:hypothetical protein
MLAAILEIAARMNVIVFDPQSGQVNLPLSLLKIIKPGRAA